MTSEQRACLDVLSGNLGSWDKFESAAIRAALADLDACRAALRPVAESLHRQGWKIPILMSLPVGLNISPEAAEAVLAAAGEEQR